MKRAMDEVRSTRQYLFWRDDDRKKGYVSAYAYKNRGREKSRAIVCYEDKSQQFGCGLYLPIRSIKFYRLRDKFW